MRKPRVEVGKLRRAQIVEAAVAVIAEKGLQELSLSAIEERTDMSRGQLTYYFRTKEDILLAVFDRLLEMLRQRVQTDADHPQARCDVAGWERLEAFLHWFVLTPPHDPAFHALQHTFLSQIGHREDFRQRLANLYEEWRGHIAADVAAETGRTATVSARTVASFVQAVLHGLSMQRAADADAFDRVEMLRLMLDLLRAYLRPTPPAARNGQSKRPARGRRAAQERKA
jgi:AcrR family transcriptional regulator